MHASRLVKRTALYTQGSRANGNGYIHAHRVSLVYLHWKRGFSSVFMFAKARGSAGGSMMRSKNRGTRATGKGYCDLS